MSINYANVFPTKTAVGNSLNLSSGPKAPFAPIAKGAEPGAFQEQKLALGCWNALIALDSLP
jgi:hypothetical protein